MQPNNRWTNLLAWFDQTFHVF